MVADASGPVQFSIGRVIKDSIGVYARNFVSFSILALVIGLLDLLVTIFYSNPEQAQTSGEYKTVGVAALVSILVTLFTSSLTQATIIYGTLQDLRGSKAGIGDCISRGLASVIPVIVGSILLSLGIGLASLLLVVPGVILYLVWWVYVPVIVVEGKSITDGFGRSGQLTKDRRWHILGLAIAFVVLAVVVGAVIGAVTALILSLSSVTDLQFMTTIIEYVANSIVGAFNAVLVAVGYYYLRMEKEGVDVNQIASVFD